MLLGLFWRACKDESESVRMTFFGCRLSAMRPRAETMASSSTDVVHLPLLLLALMVSFEKGALGSFQTTHMPESKLD